MKLNKTVTDAVRAANSANAKKSTGPASDTGKVRASENSTRHGILARRLILRTDAERREYAEHRDSFFAHYRPEGPVEKFLVEEITNTTWKLGETERLETRELSSRQEAEDFGGGIEGVFGSDLKLPIDEVDLPLDRRWDCERMVVRAIAGDEHSNANGRQQPLLNEQQVIAAVKCTLDNRSKTGGQLELQAVLTNPLETLTRYRSTLKRDFYRAAARLDELQERRRERKRKMGKHKKRG